jgi:DNA-directed RNA polymerase specialized sigma subunit
MSSEADKNEALAWVLDKLAAATRPAQPNFGLPKIQQTPEQKKQELKAKQPKEVELWKTYKANEWDPKHLDPLIKSFQGLINSHVTLFRNRTEIPTSVIDQTFKNWFAKGLQSYNPNKGAQLNTWLTRSLQKGHRELNANKQLNYVPENVSSNITSYNAFKGELKERLGYQPNAQTIHDEAVKAGHPKLGTLSLRQIKRLEKDQRPSLVQFNRGADAFFEQEMDPRHVEVAHLVIPELSKLEKEVHEYTLGINGKPKMKSGQIAKKLNISGPKVSRIRSDIWSRMKPHLGD